MIISRNRRARRWGLPTRCCGCVYACMCTPLPCRPNHTKSVRFHGSWEALTQSTQPTPNPHPHQTLSQSFLAAARAHADDASPRLVEARRLFLARVLNAAEEVAAGRGGGGGVGVGGGLQRNGSSSSSQPAALTCEPFM